MVLLGSHKAHNKLISIQGIDKWKATLQLPSSRPRGVAQLFYTTVAAIPAPVCGVLHSPTPCAGSFTMDELCWVVTPSVLLRIGLISMFILCPKVAFKESNAATNQFSCQEKLLPTNRSLPQHTNRRRTRKLLRRRSEIAAHYHRNWSGAKLMMMNDEPSPSFYTVQYAQKSLTLGTGIQMSVN
nr:hypothetical protein Iba_chr01aCG4460 [Ipomoea batatas]